MPYNCLRNAYQKPSFVQGLSMAPLRHPWGPAKAFGHEHKRNDSSLFPFFFSSLLSLFLFSLCDVLPGSSLVLLSFILPVFFVGLCVPSLLSLGFHSFITFFSLWAGFQEASTISRHLFGFWVAPWVLHLGGRGEGHTLGWHWTWAQSDEGSEVPWRCLIYAAALLRLL